MLKLGTVSVGEYATNCYLLTCPETSQSLVVDPGGSAETVLALCEGTHVTRVLLTHGHPDHVLGMNEVRDALGAPVAVHPADAAEFGIVADFELRDGMRLRVGRHFVQVVHVPGHTPGSVALRFGRRAIVGDAIFPGGPGRTDTSSALRTLLHSLERTIFTWPDDTCLYPGHGGSTSVGAERLAFEEFLARPRRPDLCGDVTWHPPDVGGGP